MAEKLSASELYFLRKNDKFVEQHLSDFILCQIYSRTVFEKMAQQWEILPPYIQNEVPYAIRQKAFSSHLKGTESFLSEYWLRKGFQVLSDYNRALVPYSEDYRTDFRMENLLSLKGFYEWQWLKRALWQGRTGQNVTFRAMKSANKFLLNIKLFKNFNLLKNTTIYSRPQFGRIILSVSTGCYNMCSHCGYSATAPVSHMPYPVFIQLAHLFGRNLCSRESGVAQFYSDSDPIAYRDKVINADIGDICRYVQTQLPEEKRLAATFVSKGVLQKGDEEALAKAFECNPISLSYVDLPGEKNIERNKIRIERSLNALKQVPQERKGNNIVELRHICLSGAQSKKEEFDLSSDALFRQINPVFNGRWVKTCSEEHLPNTSWGNRSGFSSFTNTVIKPDGTIYECALKANGYDFYWKKLGNIFNFIDKERD